MKSGIVIGHLAIKNNEAAIIRTAEAFGINNVYVIGKKQESYKAAEGCERHVNFFEFKNWDDFIGYARQNNHSIVSIENIGRSKEISEVERYPVNPIFITGHENTGIPEEVLYASSLCLKIEQGMGYANCLNTSTAMGIVLHDFFKKNKLNKSKKWEQ